jgi:hypothetical protein
MVAVVAVAEIQPRDIHTSLDKRPDLGVTVGGRAEGADDLGAPGHDA